tara:strand:+ start:1011 stop:1661 length:651 start_codon:yes stop_codon:yes gene_type:complete
MSTIKVDTIATRTGSGNITLSNNVASLTSAGAISGTNLTASGTLGVTGNTTVGGTLVNTGLITASAGVAIGGTGSANTLDDYEEGSFTPTLLDGAGASQSVTGAVGRYTKLGNVVHVYSNFSKATASGNGSTLKVGGLPFTSGSGLGVMVNGGMWLDEGGPTGPDEVGITYIGQSSTTIEGVKSTTDAQRADTRYFQYSDLSNGRPLYMSMTYRVD